MRIYRYIQKNTGFTVVETLVSLFIFSLSIVVLILITGTGIHNTNFAKNRLTANYLAQEGFELVRNARDTAVRYGTSQDVGWEGFVDMLDDAGCFTDDGCMVEPLADHALTNVSLNSAFEPCSQASEGTGCDVFSRTASGFYSISLGTEETSFAREIRADRLSGDAIAIVVDVYWRQGQNIRQVSVDGHLYKWITPVTI